MVRQNRDIEVFTCSWLSNQGIVHSGKKYCVVWPQDMILIEGSCLCSVRHERLDRFLLAGEPLDAGVASIRVLVWWSEMQAAKPGCLLHAILPTSFGARREVFKQIETLGGGMPKV